MNIENRRQAKVNANNNATKLLIGLHIGFLIICAIFLSITLSMREYFIH